MDALTDQAHFDALYAESDDPWSTLESWYEMRKRTLLCAALPQWYYDTAIEPGCGPGALTEMLGPRCGRLVASDLNHRAVTAAQRRVEHMPHVKVECASFPAGVAAEPVDLIVLCELGYYFEDADWAAAVASVDALLKPTGTVVACHWKHPFEHRRNSTDAVHSQIAAMPGLHRQSRHEEADFLLEVWTRQTESIAQREQRL